MTGRCRQVWRGGADTGSDRPEISRSEAALPSATRVNRILTILFGFLAVLFFVLAVIGTVRNYSPVPLLDMWDDYIGFYLRVHAGAWGAWWAQHNEHRIVLSRLFFWIDIAWFHGNGIFSFVVIYVFALAAGLIYAKIWQEQSQGQDLYILFFVEAWIFSWTQKENLTWAFQSQFILAQLLPLAGLYFLHLSLSQPNKTRIYFVAATVCGVLAVGSMANGVLALPAMGIYALIAARSFRQTAFFIVLSAIEIELYFYHSHSTYFPGAAATLTGEISQHPVGFIQFCLSYLGGPFIALLGSTPLAILIGAFSGAALVLITVSAFLNYLLRAERPSLPLALLVYIFYIMATAAITAAGRLALGPHAALAGRYQTPALYGWAAALLLFWPMIAKSVKFRTVFSLFLVTLMCFWMLPWQLQALTFQREMLFHRDLAALSLELQINDVDRILLIYPIPAAALEFANGARQEHISVFGFAPLDNAHLLLGQKITAWPLEQCRGYLDRITMIPAAPHYVRVQGWLYNARHVATPGLVLLTTQTKKIVGLGLLGAERTDVSHEFGRKALYTGFEAYLSVAADGQRISVFSPVNDCALSPSIVRFNLPVSASPATPGN